MSLLVTRKPPGETRGWLGHGHSLAVAAREISAETRDASGAGSTIRYRARHCGSRARYIGLTPQETESERLKRIGREILWTLVNWLGQMSAIIRTRFTEQFGLRHPIVCAPMALVAGADLAVAVSAAGGLGIVAGLEVQLTVSARHFNKRMNTVLQRPPGTLDTQ